MWGGEGSGKGHTEDCWGTLLTPEGGKGWQVESLRQERSLRGRKAVLFSEPRASQHDGSEGTSVSALRLAGLEHPREAAVQESGGVGSLWPPHHSQGFWIVL